MNMMMWIILWSTMVVIMKKKYDPPVLPCRCKEMKSEKNFAMIFLAFWEKKNKFGERMKNAYRWTVTQIMNLLMEIE